MSPQFAIVGRTFEFAQKGCIRIEKLMDRELKAFDPSFSEVDQSKVRCNSTAAREASGLFRNNGSVLLICPTCQAVSEHAQGVASARCSFAWGCFASFGSPPAYSGRAWPRHAVPEGRSVVPLAGNRLVP